MTYKIVSKKTTRISKEKRRIGKIVARRSRRRVGYSTVESILGKSHPARPGKTESPERIVKLEGRIKKYKK